MNQIGLFIPSPVVNSFTKVGSLQIKQRSGNLINTTQSDSFTPSAVEVKLSPSIKELEQQKQQLYFELLAEQITTVEKEIVEASEDKYSSVESVKRSYFAEKELQPLSTKLLPKKKEELPSLVKSGAYEELATALEGMKLPYKKSSAEIPNALLQVLTLLGNENPRESILEGKFIKTRVETIGRLPKNQTTIQNPYALQPQFTGYIKHLENLLPKKQSLMVKGIDIPASQIIEVFSSILQTKTTIQDLNKAGIRFEETALEKTLLERLHEAVIDNSAYKAVVGELANRVK
ncbi:MAG: hypothetical protein H2174_02355 [Vampirovibrio sp.]|nr:hypothetical protein [Vampirovibrio sp.]